MKRNLTAIGLLLALFTASSAFAGVEAGMSDIEFYGGIYMPDPDFLDDEPTFGVRFGHAFTEHHGIDLQVGIVQTDLDLGEELGTVDWDTWLADVSYTYTISPAGRFAFLLFAGIGYAFVDVNTDTDVGEFDEDSFTAHAGFGSKIFFNDRWYLRFASRARFFDQREDHEIDLESTIAVGVAWGR